MFDSLFEAIEEWMRTLLKDMIDSNLATMFTDVNEKTGEIATQVGQTPRGWNASVFSMIENLSNTVILPIAGMIITFVLCYELISMLTEKNNMHDIDTWMIFKYLFKMMIAVFIVSHTFQITMPELQTLKTAVHEVVHSYLHDDRSKMLTPDGQPKNKGIIETEAEGCALVCLTHFGFEDVGDYSFPYLVSYASSPDLSELHASLATIQETSSMVISSLEEEMLQLTVERGEQGKSYAEPGLEKPDMVAEKVPDMDRRESLLQVLRDKRDMVNKEFGIGKSGKMLEARKEERAI